MWAGNGSNAPEQENDHVHPVEEIFPLKRCNIYGIEIDCPGDPIKYTNTCAPNPTQVVL